VKINIGDLVKVFINDWDENNELIPAGTHGLVVEEVHSKFGYANKVFSVKLMSSDGQDRRNSYYGSNLKVINANR